MMAKISFALVAGAAASRSEGVGMMQTGIVEQHLVGTREQRIASMQEKILQFAAAGVPAEAIDFLNTIKGTLETDILNAIRGEMTAEKGTHDNLYAAFASASETFNTDSSLESVGSAETEKSTHDTCRVQESADHAAKVTCDGEQAAARGVYDSDVSSVLALGTSEEVCPDGTGWTNSEAHGLEAYIAAGHEAIRTRGLWETKRDECNGKTNVLNAKTTECNGDQTAYEAAACSVAQNTKSANDDYTEAYNLAKTAFEQEFDGWNAQDADRINQCQLVNTLICMVQALVDHDDSADLQAAVATCDANKNSHDCAEYSFTHSATPDQLPLAVVPAAPCASDFEYFAGGNWPAGTQAGSCTACTGL